jgi:hypothetical protein
MDEEKNVIQGTNREKKISQTQKGKSRHRRERERGER